MATGKPVEPGELAPPRLKNSRGDASTIVPAHEREEPSLSARPLSAWSNVVPFAPRPREHAATSVVAPDVTLAPGDRPWPDLSARRGRSQFVAFLVFSFFLHAALYAAFDRAPAPLLSIGEEVISVEIVVGTNEPAGVADTPAENETVSEPEKEVAAVQEPPPEETAAAPEPEVTPSPPMPEPSPAPKEVSKEQPPEVQLAPRPQPKLAPKRAAKPAKQRVAARTEAAPSPSAGGVGAGRSDLGTNYRGLVAAHLARYKRFPSDARERGDQGSASISFTLDGGGRVIRVALVRGTGVASLDQEAQAMVHRASPFPAPPSGQPISFTVPVSFRIQ